MEKFNVHIDGWHHSIDLVLTEEEANIGYHSGQCADDIKALCQTDLSKQLDAITDEALEDIGEWYIGDEFKKDYPTRQDKLEFVLWLACGDFIDGEREPIGEPELVEEFA